MADNTDPRDEFAISLQAVMPPEPTGASLSRTRARATKAWRTGGRASTRAWRFAGVAVASLAAIAAVSVVLAPRLETAAFARERAADALLLETDGRVLHVVMTYTETGSGAGFEPSFALDQRWSFWVDPEGRRIREEFVDARNGSLANISVRNGDRIVVFANGAGQQLIDEKNTQQPFGTALGTMIDYVRARILDGSAKVTGTKVIDGEEYWVVEHRPERTELLTVTMRKSDYRIRTWARDFAIDNEQGTGTGAERVTFEVVEQIEPGTLPKDFFSFDQVFGKAKPGTKVEHR